MSDAKRTFHASWQRLSATVLLSWLAMLGFDFFLHAGLLARLYLAPTKFLLPAREAFVRIPWGYLSFLLAAMMLTWLMSRLDVSGWQAGFGFGLTLGGLVWGSLALGLWSITTASAPLLVGWFAGQSLELGLGGAVVGHSVAGGRLSRLVLLVLAFLVLAVAVTIVMQSLGLAPAVRV